MDENKFTMDTWLNNAVKKIPAKVRFTLILSVENEIGEDVVGQPNLTPTQNMIFDALVNSFRNNIGGFTIDWHKIYNKKLDL